MYKLETPLTLSELNLIVSCLEYTLQFRNLYIEEKNKISCLIVKLKEE